MSLYVISIAMTVVANLTYHLFQKLIHSEANPFISLGITYGTALTVTVLCYCFWPAQTNLKTDLSQMNWASFALGFSIVLLELGFLLAYRAGWNISLAALYSNVIVALLLIPIGLHVFQESLDWNKGLGALFALIGIILISK